MHLINCNNLQISGPTTKRGPGRPRKNHEDSGSHKKKHSSSERHSSPDKSQQNRGQKRPRSLSPDEESDVKSHGDSGELSPPILEPWSASPKSSKSTHSDVLRPPTLTPNKVTPPVLPCTVNGVKSKEQLDKSSSPVQVSGY